MVFKVTFWDGEKKYTTTKKEAVKTVKSGLKEWMHNGDKMLWTHQHPDDLLLSATFVLDKLGDATKASALIEENHDAYTRILE